MRASKKGFHYFKKFLPHSFLLKRLIKQVLTPPLVPVADKPHQLPRGMQRERPRPPRQLESGLFRRPVALAVVATVATRHQVFPRRTPSARPRHDMVQRQFRAGKNSPAKLASIPVP